MEPEENVVDQVEALRQVCQTWLRDSLDFIRTLSQVPAYEDFDVTFSPDGTYSTSRGETKIHFDSLFEQIHQQLFNSPKFEALVGLILTSPDLSNAFFLLTSAEASKAGR
jgi:hypothetical protein